MITIRSGKGLKLATFLILATLIVGIAAAEDHLEWTSPENESAIPDEYALNVTDSQGVIADDENEYINLTRSLDNETWTQISLEQLNEEGYIEYEWEDTPTSGDYYLRAVNTNNTDRNATIIITLDKSSPEVDSQSPTGYISDDSPEVGFEASDEHTSVNYTELTVEDSDNEEVGSYSGASTSPELSLEDLSHGAEYTVSWYVNDTVGNDNEGDWTFTVDTSYDGDTSPSFSPNGGMLLTEEFEDDYNGEVTVTLSDTGDEVSRKELTCYDGGGSSIDSTGFQTVDDSSTDFTCDVSMNEYGGSIVDIYVEICDEAGNCYESDSVEFVFDAEPPRIFDLETSSGHNYFNTDFGVELEAFDDASGVDSLEYYFDPETDEGDGNEISYSSEIIEFEADTSGLDSGEHTLYVRGLDNAGRWSDASMIEFEYYPGETPEIGIETPENVTVTAGDATSFEVTVENTGKLFVEDVTVEASAENVFNDSETISELQPEEAISFGFGIDTEDENLGEHTVDVSSDSPSEATEFALFVTANEDQQQQISSDLSGYSGSLEELRANITRLEEDGLSEERQQRLESDMASFEEKVADAETAIEEGRYYEAEQILSGIETDLDDARQSYQGVREEHEIAQRNRMIMVGLAFIGLLGIGAAVFFVSSDEYDFDFKEIYDSDIDIASLDDIESRLRTLFKNEEEAEEFAWNGFKN